MTDVEIFNLSKPVVYDPFVGPRPRTFHAQEVDARGNFSNNSRRTVVLDSGKCGDIVNH